MFIYVAFTYIKNVSTHTANITKIIFPKVTKQNIKILYLLHLIDILYKYFIWIQGIILIFI